jgi:hypothetical protein
MRSSRSSFLAAAAVLLAGAGVHVVDASRVSHEQSARELREARDTQSAMQLRAAQARDTAAWSIFGRGGWDTPRYPRPGWSVKQGQRAASKARNQRRHRRACRKGGRK